jgi:membrane-associated protease RseP (regulator of RpoE activity)
MARVHKVPVKSTGILFFGPIMGAFVQPDEKQLAKKDDTAQYSIMAAGPFFNIISALIVFLVFSNWLIPLTEGAIFEPGGYQITGVLDDNPAMEAGIEAGHIITEIDGEPIRNASDFRRALWYYRPGSAIEVIANESSFTVITGKHPEDEKLSYFGVYGKTHLVARSSLGDNRIFLTIWKFIAEFFFWFYVLSLGIGIINLYPFFITDGAQLLRVSFLRIWGKERGMRFWMRTNSVCLFVLSVIVIFGIGRWLFGILV